MYLDQFLNLFFFGNGNQMLLYGIKHLTKTKTMIVLVRVLRSIVIFLGIDRRRDIHSIFAGLRSDSNSVLLVFNSLFRDSRLINPKSWQRSNLQTHNSSLSS
ncbi:hypothetical protein MIDIC_490039 [Alphaproteobacteria bacterium]